MEGPSSAEEESEDDSDGEAFDSVTVDFDFSEPQEDDFLGLKVLLTNYLDGVTYDGSGLVDLVLKHSKLGTVIKCEDDVLGVTTVLPLASVAGTRSLSDLGKFLLARSLADKAMGLLLSERLINCPPAVAPPLQQALREDLQAHQGKAELIFTQPEVECCFKHAVWTAEFAARETQEGRNKSCRPVRLILCIPCAALHRIGQDLEALLGSPAE
ncbi:Protein BCP1 [Auxenochlorella protothecoides]|nr:Protein BCP1 [Auxenochlorella protothecoides]KFM23931.1 Protein BCP1 [Auxenochlorella protothecoides]